MPDFPGVLPPSTENVQNVTIGFVDLLGNTANLRISGIDVTVTNAEVNALRQAAGAISNAGVYFDGLELIQQLDTRDALAYIDPFVSVSSKGVFRFDHPDSKVEEIYMEIPAIYSGFVTDGGSLNDQDTEVQAFITAALAVLNKVQLFSADYYFAKAYFSDRKGTSKTKPQQAPTSRDPRNP